MLDLVVVAVIRAPVENFDASLPNVFFRRNTVLSIQDSTGKVL